MTTLFTQAEFKDGPVVLVSAPINFTFPLSYAYLAGYLLQQGQDVRVLFKDIPPKKLVSQIMDLNPVVVGFGNLYPELKGISELIRMLDEAKRQFPIVIGGQMVSPTPEFALEISGADFGVIGEGEIVLHQLVTALRKGDDPASIKGLVLRDNGRFVQTGPGEFIEDLRDLPPIPYELFPEEKWLPIGRWYAENLPQPHWRFNDRVINVHGGRGCPFKCNFCYHHGKPRYRPISNMMEDATAALDRFDGNVLYFSDDLVLASPKRARRLVDALGGLNRDIEYSISARFDTLARLDDDLLKEMKSSGCRIMGLGIESGSDRILKLIGKKCTADTVRSGLERLKNVGILPTVSIMIGQQSETKEDVEKSIALMKQSVDHNPNIQYAFTITTPFPGSPLYDHIFEKGLLKSDHEFYSIYFSSPGEWNQVVNLSAMPDRTVFEMFVKIKQAYVEQKEKLFGKNISRIVSMQLIVGRINNNLYRWTLAKVPQKGLFSVLHKLHDLLYSSVQRFLEYFHLRMRGLRP